MLFPDDVFVRRWNFITIALLIYSVTVVPFQVSFLDPIDECQPGHCEPLTLKFIGLLFDSLFSLDIIFQFFTPYRDKHQTLVIYYKKIAINYFKTWFLCD